MNTSKNKMLFQIWRLKIMNKKTNKKLKPFLNKNKVDKTNQLLNLASKHGKIHVKHKNKSFVLMKATEYESLLSEKQELEKSITSLLTTIDAESLLSPKAKKTH